MNKEAINEIIERQGVYEIEYEKEGEVNIYHISNIMFSRDFGESYLFAYCQEVGKELTYNTMKILSIQKYWIGIMSKDTTAPNDGIYLVVRCGLGQGIDMAYELLTLKKGDLFVGRESSWDKPIAYHFIPTFGETDGTWIDKEITMKKWVNETISAPIEGIPIIAYQRPQKDKESKVNASIDYCIGNGDNNGRNTVEHGVQNNSDITTFFKEWDCVGPFGWSEHWDGYKILGFVMVNEYDMFACLRHIEMRLKVEPDFYE